MDTIHVKGARAFGYTGVLQEEKVLGQWYEVDMAISIDLSIAGKSDVLGDTYSYVGVIQETKKIIQNGKYDLIERLIDVITTSALESDERIMEITTTLKKLTPPIPDFDGHVAVEITRRRVGKR